MNKTVFLFATHKLTDFVLEQYYRLKLATKNIGVLYLLIEDGELQQIPVDVKYYSFSVDTLNELNYEPIEESIIPGSNHFPVLQFYKEHPEFYTIGTLNMMYILTESGNPFLTLLK